MFWSRIQLAARKREDSRPLYRRIFTNRRLDIAHKGTIIDSYLIYSFNSSHRPINSRIYCFQYILLHYQRRNLLQVSALSLYWKRNIFFRFVRPIRQEEREILERELIEADKAGFAFKKSVIVFDSFASLIFRWFVHFPVLWSSCLLNGKACFLLVSVPELDLSFSKFTFLSKVRHALLCSTRCDFFRRKLLQCLKEATVTEGTRIFRTTAERSWHHHLHRQASTVLRQISFSHI